MYQDITFFNQEQEMYKNKVNEIMSNNYADDILKIKLNEEETKYKNSIRKYLSNAINNLNGVTNNTFSLYKMGKDLDANFKVIEAKIRKSKEELIEEFNELRSSIELLDEKQKNLVNISINVIIDYSDSKVIDKARENYINR